ncbi:MAG TPA: DUF4242 domain-containing protein [Holophagaceae bacterium]|nr:DUF4242 domain-containing protein [Holophagaceae bacterium]
MPRYLIERSFPDVLRLGGNHETAAAVDSVLAINGEQGVTWVHSYVSEDRKQMFCVYEGPNPEAIRRVSEKNRLPVDRITRISVLDPHFLH